MKPRFIPTSILVLYIVILIDVMVFKYVPEIHIGGLRLRFGGTHEGAPNFVPLKSIFGYLRGRHGLLIGAINLAGNILLLVPVGILAPFVAPKMSLKNALVLGFASGLAIETMQVIFHVGIFDIDDIILNALGVLLGYWLARKFGSRRAAG